MTLPIEQAHQYATSGAYLVHGQDVVQVVGSCHLDGARIDSADSVERHRLKTRPAEETTIAEMDFAAGDTVLMLVPTLKV